MIENHIWVEKYRPDDLANMALSEENRHLLAGMIAAEEIPHLLLHGPPGVGKTTLAKILTHELDCSVLQLNASSERGIDVVREKIQLFVRGLMGKKWNVVFLDEADAMTHDAQTALRNMMETFSGTSRFILTCNYLHKIISPIQSRCMAIELAQMSLKQRYDVLFGILTNELGELAEKDRLVALEYAERYTDLRRMITAAQKSVMAHGSIQSPSVAQMDGTKILLLVDEGDWNNIRTLSKGESFDHRQGLIDLFWALEAEPDPSAMVLVGKAVHESGWTPDSVVHFLATIAEVKVLRATR